MAPVQLENVTVPHCLDGFHVLLLSYDGQKPLTPEVHPALASWVRQGGVLVVCDADADPYAKVREWWNTAPLAYATPREALFQELGLPAGAQTGRLLPVGKGGVIWLHERPVTFSTGLEPAQRLVATVKEAAQATGLSWRETNYLLLRRGPYVIGAGLDESVDAPPHAIAGHLIDLFDPELKLQSEVKLAPGARHFLLDLDAVPASGPRVLLSACKALPSAQTAARLALTVEGVAQTPAILLIRANQPPRSVSLEGQPVSEVAFDASAHLLRVRFENQAQPRALVLEF